MSPRFPTLPPHASPLTGGLGVERAVDCSANDSARAAAIRATRKWGRIVFLGEGGRVEFNPSPDIIHDQKTIYGSWVTSIWLMEELVERLVRWNLHPAGLITHRFPPDTVLQEGRNDARYHPLPLTLTCGARVRLKSRVSNATPTKRQNGAVTKPGKYLWYIALNTICAVPFPTPPISARKITMR